MLEATTYTRIYGQQQLAKCWCVARSQPTRKIFVVKLYSCKIFSYVFCVRKYFCNEQKANYGSIVSNTVTCAVHTSLHISLSISTCSHGVCPTMLQSETLFKCGKKNSLVPRVRTFVETIASTLGLVLPSVLTYNTLISWMA